MQQTFWDMNVMSSINLVNKITPQSPPIMFNAYFICNFYLMQNTVHNLLQNLTV